MTAGLSLKDQWQQGPTVPRPLGARPMAELDR